MEHKLIQTENYLLVVDDSEIKYDDHFIDEYKMLYMLKNGSIETYKSAKKVITHLPLNNSPILTGVHLLPPLEDEAESLSLKSVNKRGYTTDDYQDGFEDGYNKAKEKYKYTEDNIKMAYMEGFNRGKDNNSNHMESYIQFLNQPKMPIGFECDMKQKSINGSIPVNQVWEYEPKTTTNSQGLTQLVGKYVY